MSNFISKTLSTIKNKASETKNSLNWRVHIKYIIHDTQSIYNLKQHFFVT